MADNTKGSAEPTKKRRFLKAVAFCVGLTLILIAGAGVFYKMLLPRIYFAITTPTVKPEFPDFSSLDLSADVKNLLLLAKNEYENPKSGDFYADGISEPWCADFVSYLYKEIGRPLSNPNTGYWRIPGVYTLRDYLQNLNVWHTESDYLPKLGDIVIYDGGLFGGHTNIVVETSEDYIVVLGGNENDQIRLDKIDWKDKKYGVLGFGHLL